MNIKNIAAGSVGSLVEWAEFTFYGYLVITFSHLFFSMLPPKMAILAALCGFAISYLARPLGSFFFGLIGDHQGRQKSLAYSILLMGFATLGIGLLPTYASLGITAPLLMLLFRFLQGFSIGGEFTGSAIFMIEHAPERPYFSASWMCAAAAAGMLVGGIAAVLISLPSAPSWAWRIPFICGGCACWLGFFIRYRLSETSVFQKLAAAKHLVETPIKTLLIQYKKQLLQIAALAIYFAIYIYICNVWWITYASQSHYFKPLVARGLATFAQACVVIFTPLLALATEKIGGKWVLRFGTAGSFLISPLLFWLTARQNLPGLVVVEIFYALFLAATTPAMFKCLAELLPAGVRYTGLAIGWNVGVALFGGTAPLVAQLFVNSHWITGIPLYVTLSGCLALLASFSFTDIKSLESSELVEAGVQRNFFP